jgi:hypothetical protein
MTKAKKSSKKGKVGPKTQQVSQELSEEQLEHVAGGSFQWGVGQGTTQGGSTVEGCATGDHIHKLAGG